MPADARREPPSDAGHGQGRPPDGPPEEGSWAFARGLKSMFGWPQSNAAPPLPPLTSSGLRGLRESGQDDGGVHRPSASPSSPTTANGSTVLLFYYVLIGPSLYMIRFDYVSRWILLVVDIDLPVCTGRPIPMTSE